jgi:hypothetical protein
MVECRQLKKVVSVKNFEAAARIPDTVTKQFRANGICDSGRYQPNPFVPSSSPFAYHHAYVCCNFQSSEKCGDVGRVILAIAVKNGDNWCACSLDARSYCGTLTAIAFMILYSKRLVSSQQIGKLIARFVCTPVIDDNDFIPKAL